MFSLVKKWEFIIKNIMKILSQNFTPPQISSRKNLDPINSTTGFEKADQEVTLNIRKSLDEVGRLLEQIGS